MNTGDTDYFTDLKIEAGDNVTRYSSYNMGCTSIVVSNSNIARIENLGQNIELTENGLKYINNIRFDITCFKLEKGKTIKVGFKLLTGLNNEDNVMISGWVNGTFIDDLEFNDLETYELNKTYERTYTTTEDCTISFNFSGSSKNNFEFQFWINFDELEEYTQNESELKIIEIQQPMLTDDTFIKEDDGWKEVHNWAKIDSYNGESITAEYISTTGELTTGATVYYKLETPTKLVCTEKQKEQLDDLLNTITYKNLTYVYSVDAIIYYRDRVSPIVKITYVKDLEAYINKSQEEQNKKIDKNIEDITAIQNKNTEQDNKITENTDALTKANAKIAELEQTVALQDEQIPRRRRRRREHYINR